MRVPLLLALLFVPVAAAATSYSWAYSSGTWSHDVPVGSGNVEYMITLADAAPVSTNLHLFRVTYVGAAGSPTASVCEGRSTEIPQGTTTLRIASGMTIDLASCITSVPPPSRGTATVTLFSWWET